MRVYLAYLRLGALDGLQYRVEAFIWFLFDLLPPIVMIALWLAAYEGREEIAGYRLEQMLGYYVGVLVLGTLLTAHVEWEIAHQVRQGLLSAALLRPASPWVGWFMQALGWKLVRVMFLAPSTLLLALLLGGNLALPPLSPDRAAALALSLALAYLLCFAFKALLGMAAFWVTEVSGLIGLWEVLMFLLGGTLLPLEFLPAPLQALAAALPFKYIFAFPLGLALGRLEWPEVWQGLLVQAGWLLGGLALAWLIWRQGLRRYEAVGA